MTATTKAQVTRRCCNWSGVPTGNPRLAHWELYVVVYNTTAEWPSVRWSAARRDTIPTLDERAEALSRLGYQAAPDAEWEWQETETPGYHGHPARVSMLGSISIVPLTAGAGEES